MEKNTSVSVALSEEVSSPKINNPPPHAKIFNSPLAIVYLHFFYYFLTIVF
jgi:hypothetical protein